jgi:hypothetical protein
MTEDYKKEQAAAQADRNHQVENLMRDIDDKVARFCALTGANGKIVKKNWRRVKQSSKTALPDRLQSAEENFEKILRDYYVARGHVVGDGTWEFQVTLTSRYGSKHMLVLFDTDELEEAELAYQAEAATLDTLYADATAFFTEKEPK